VKSVAGPIEALNSIEGYGYGSSPSQAKRDALSRIFHQVNEQINYRQCVNNTDTDHHCTNLSFYFDAPLTMVTFEAVGAKIGEFGQKAVLNKDSVLTTVGTQLPELQKDISAYLSKETISPEDLQSLWRSKNKFFSYKALLSLFNPESTVSLSANQRATLDALEIAAAQELDSLDNLASYVLQLGPVQKAFIHAPRLVGSVEMTPFSELVRSTLAKQLSSAFPGEKIKVRGIKSKDAKPAKQCYDTIRSIEINCDAGNRISIVQNSKGEETLLIGRYTPLDDYILLRYELIGAISGLKNTLFLKIRNNLIGNTRTNAINSNFDQNLHQNILGDSNFQVQLGSSRGNRNILIFEQEDIALKLKSTSAAYFYIVGHVVHKDAQYSYLVELHADTRSFVGKITKEQVNRWVDIGEFSIEPPFGVEHIQLIAANYDLSEDLPATKWNDDLGYHIITGSENNAMKGLQTVRGLQRVCSSATTRGLQRDCTANVKVSAIKEQNITIELEHESVLSYTSLPIK
jgi:hypothetical protein